MPDARPICRIAMLSLHTCPAATPGQFKTGGMNVYVRELSQALARRGIAVDIFTRQQDSCRDHPDDWLSEAPTAAPVRLIHVPAGPGEAVDPEALQPFVADFARAVEAFAAAEHDSQPAYDVIYAHYWLSGLAGLSLRDRWQVPLIQMFHTLGIMKDRIAGQPDAVPGPRALTEAQIMTAADRLIAATPAEAMQMTRLYGAPARSIHIVPPGVDPDRFFPADRAAARARTGLVTAEPLLLFVGRPEPLKALDSIVIALSVLFDYYPERRERLRLVVIGGQRQEAAVQMVITLAKRLGVDQQITWIEAQPQAALPDYYRAADALLMPSDYESFGMAALEALASGTPVIASQVGGLAYLIADGQNGYLIPTRDQIALADAIRRLVTLPDERARLAINAAHSAEPYHWAHIAERLLTVFSGC